MIHHLCANIIGLYKDYHVHRLNKVTRRIGNPPVLNYATGFFDGASTLGNGGAGTMLVISKEHFLKIRMRCGKSSNTRVELLALWILLYFVSLLGLPSLEVFGDSKFIVDSSNSLSKLQALELN